MNLPSEVWDLICQHVNSKTDLFQLLLVNRTLFQSTVRWLWYSLIVDDDRRMGWIRTLIPEYPFSSSTDRIEHQTTAVTNRSTLKRTVSAVVGEQDGFMVSATTANHGLICAVPRTACKEKPHEKFAADSGRPIKYGRLVRSLSVQSSTASSTSTADYLYDCLPQLLELRHLNAAGCLFLDHRIASCLTFHCASTLQSISLANCDMVTDDSIVSLASAARNLQDVCLNRCHLLTDRSMEAMADSLCRLNRLCIAKLPLISAIGVNCVAKGCSELISLDLTRCTAVLGTELRQLFEFGRGLRYLNLSCIPSGTDGDIRLLGKYCTELRELSLERWALLTDDALLTIGTSLRKLERLNLTFLFQLTSDGLKNFASVCSHRLFEIFLGKCSNITNEGIIQLAHNIPKLRRVYLAGCRAITDEAIIQLIQRCNQMEVLSLPGCSVTDVSVVAAAKHLHQTLTVAQFSFCPDVSPMAICRLAHQCQRLEILQLVQCRRILDSFVREYSQPCPLHLLTRYDGIYCAIRPPNIRRLGERYSTTIRIPA